MVNINEFVKIARYLDHVNFSGMNLKKDQIFQLIEILRNCVFLCAIHLSDNGITVTNEFYYDCLDQFKITEEDLIEINRSKRNDLKLHPAKPKKYDKLDIDYKSYLSQYFNFEPHMKCGHSLDKE